MDAHAKNYSVLLSGREARLAPLYDLMCGAAWPNVTQNMAQSIGGQDRGRHVYARHWRRMAESCGLSAPAVLREVVALAGRVAGEVAHAADEVRGMPAGDHPMLEQFASAILEWCKLVAANARRDGPDGDPEDRPQEEAAGATTPPSLALP